LSLNPQSAARTASAAPPPRAAETAATGAYVVQLAAHKTQEEASAAFRSAQSRYPGVLGGQKMLIRKKEVAGQGTFYGAQVGPFASRSDAVSLCENLKSAGGTCIVQRN
jgi:cell division septation protein DedD